MTDDLRRILSLILAEIEDTNRLLTDLLKLQVPEHPSVEDMLGNWEPDA